MKQLGFNSFCVSYYYAEEWPPPGTSVLPGEWGRSKYGPVRGVTQNVCIVSAYVPQQLVWANPWPVHREATALQVMLTQKHLS